MKPILLIFSLIISLFGYKSFAQWSTDPEHPGLVCDVAGVQNKVKSIADGYGGAYIFWLDTRNNPGYMPREIYGQHYDSEGYKLWEPDGRVVMNHYNGIWAYDVKRADNGVLMMGMITQGLGSGYGDSLRFQKLDEFGDEIWSHPLLVSNSAYEPNYILGFTSFILLPVGSEFYAMTEVTYFGGANGNRFSRFDDDGNLLTVYDGVPVGNQYYIGRTECKISNDGSGDFFLYHAMGNGSGAALHCYRYTNTGSVVWGPVDVVQGTNGLSYKFGGTLDDHGLTFVWQGMGASSVDLFARRLNLNGTFGWGGTTVNICTADGSQDNFDLKEKDGIVYITWADGRPGVDPGYYDMYAQKMDTTGYLYWWPDGIEIASFNTYIPYPMLEIMDDNSIIVNHQSNVAGFMAQKVNDDGSLPWGPEAMQICTTTFNPFYDLHTLFQSGENTVVVWNTGASGGGADGVYITRIDAFTGVSEEDGDQLFTMYPNPADDKLEITLSDEFNTESIKLFNVTGQLIETIVISPGVPEKQIGLDVSGLPAGIYFLNVNSGRENIGKKLIIQ